MNKLLWVMVLCAAGCRSSTGLERSDGGESPPTPDVASPLEDVAAEEVATVDVAAATEVTGAASLTPDALPDLAEPDVVPDAAADMAVDLSPDLAPDLAPDLPPPDLPPPPPDLPPPPPDLPACPAPCPCPAPSNGDLFVDPVAGNDTPGMVAPSGASAPAACRFRTITRALAAATGATRRIVVNAVGSAMLMNETAPLRIPGGLTLTSEGPADRYTIALGGATGTAVSLGDGASLTGFTVSAGGTAVACAGQGTLRSVVLRGAGKGQGIAIGVAGRCTLTAEDVTVARFETGVLVQAGGLTATRLVSIENGQHGLHVQDGDIGTITLGAGSRFDGNTVDGVRFERGTLVGTEVQIARNKLNGITVRGGTLTLHRSRVLANADLGILNVGGQVVVDDGTQLNENGASGIKLEGGDLKVGAATGAPVELSRNGALNALYGVNIDGPAATVTITRAVMRENHGYGVKVLFQSPDATMSITDTELSKNRLGGIYLRQAEASGSRTPLVVDGVRILENGMGGQTGFGVHMSGNNGSIASTIRNSVIRDNGDVGIWIDQPAGHTTVSVLEGNEIDGNNRTAGRPAGGIYFAAPSTLRAFTGNKIHDNAGDELGFAASPNGGGAWSLRGSGGCGTAAVNRIYCYGSGAVGLRLMGGAGITVDAQAVSWQNAIPTAGADFAAAAGTVQAGGACAPAGAGCR